MKKKGGNKVKCLKNKDTKEKDKDIKDIQFKGDGQEYGTVEKIFSVEWIDVKCLDGLMRRGKIRGSFKGKMSVAPGDIVLVSLRDYQDYKCDILLKYSPKEKRHLQSSGEIPADLDENKIDEEDDTELGFTFEDI